MNVIHDRRSFLRYLGGIAAVPFCPTLQQPARPMNVLFIATDDLRFELGCYGDPCAITPHIDALARRGLTFTRAYCQQALCNPSRASLMTGRRPDTLKVWDLQTHFREEFPDIVTLPQYFKQFGYHAQGIGKIFHNGEGQQDPESWSVPSSHSANPHWKDWVLPGRPGEIPISKQGATQCLDVADTDYWDGQISEKAVAALRNLRGQPFFLAVGFWKPHLPFNAPKKYWDLYDRNSFSRLEPAEAPRDVPAIALHDWQELRNYQGIPKQGPLSKEQVLELRHGYYAAISFLDAQVGKLLAELERSTLIENTLIVFWSDHGYHLGEHDLWCKTTNFELDTRTPLIISTPGMATSGQTTQGLVELVDLYPSLVELCGLPQPEGLEGTSLAPLLADPEQDWKRAAFSQHHRPHYGKEKPQVMGYSMRTARYRYTEWRRIGSKQVTARELYDHDSDPLETRNLAGDAGYKAELLELSRALDAGPAEAVPPHLDYGRRPFLKRAPALQTFPESSRLPN